MKTGSKWVTVVLWILIAMFTVAIIGGGGYYLYTQLVEDDGSKDRPSHEIVVNETIEVLSDRTLDISPELVDSEGNPILGKFTYKYGDYKTYIRITDGVIKVLKPYDGDIKVTITEENTGLSKTVTVKIVSVLSDVLKIDQITNTPNGEVSEGLLENSLSTLSVGESYVFEVVTMPAYADVSRYFNLTATDSFGNVKNVFTTSVNDNRITLTAIGVGSGDIHFSLKNPDRGLDYTLDLPFNVSFEDKAFNQAVLNTGNGLLSQEEIQQIKTLVFGSDVNLLTTSDWEQLRALEKVVFEYTAAAPMQMRSAETVSSVVQVTNLNQINPDVIFRVNGLDTYQQYVAHPKWEGRTDMLYPYVEDPNKPVVVYHNEDTYTLSGTALDGNSLYSLDQWEELDYVGDNGSMLYADCIEAGYAVRSLRYKGYTFTGWKDADGTSFTDEDLSSIQEGIHVYAGWKANQYEVTLDGLYVDGTTNKKVSVTYNQGISTLPDGVKDGWTFEGWYLSDAYDENEKISEGFIYRTEGNKTLYAKYSATITLAYTAEVDEESIVAMPIVYGKTLDALPETVTASEWTFGGWYDSNTYSDSGKVTSTTVYTREGSAENGFSHTLYSKFTSILTFDALQIAQSGVEDLVTYAGLTLSQSLAVEGKGRTWETLVADGGSDWTFAGWTEQTYYNTAYRKGFETTALEESLILNGEEECNLTRKAVYAIYEGQDTYQYGINGEHSFQRTVVYGCTLVLPYGDEAVEEQIFVEGYKVVGWYLGYNTAQNHSLISQTKTYAVKYYANTYYVSFLDDAGTEINRVEYHDVGTSSTDNVLNNDVGNFAGRTITLGATPLKAGYTGYWAYNSENIGVDTWTVPADIFANISVQAVYPANFYTIKFDTKGVAEVADKLVAFNEKCGVLPTPSAPAGFTFDGWYTADDTQVTSDTIYTSVGDTTLYAKYVMTITLHRFADTDTQTVVYAAPYTFERPADNTGWSFNEWYYMDGNTEQTLIFDDEENFVIASFTSTVTEYYSRWKRDITLVAGEGFTTTTSISVERGKSIATSGETLPQDANIEKSGDAQNWTFKTWYYLQNGQKVTAVETDTALVANTDITTLSALYTSTVNVSIDYRSQDGGLGTVSMQGYTVTLGEELFQTLTSIWTDGELAADEAYGYYFSGWSVGEDATVYTAGNAELSFAKKTLHAQFTKAKYTVVYVAGAEGVMNLSDPQEGYCDEIFTLARVPSKTGYTFQGWALSGDDLAPAHQGMAYGALEQVSNLSYRHGGTVTATAVWMANTYTVQYDLQGGEGAIQPVQKAYDEEFKLADAVTKTGYTFNGWAVEGGKTYNAGQMVSNLASTQDAVVELVAIWVANKYIITYDVAGGSAIADTSATYDEECRLAEASERVGYTFQGWEINGVTYAASEKVLNLTTGDLEGTVKLTATAIWEAIEYELIYLDENNQRVGNTTYKYTIESTSYPQPAVPEKVGYIGKWDMSGIITGETIETVTIKPIYTLRSYTVTYYADDVVIKQLSYTIEQYEGMDDSQEPNESEIKEKYPNPGYSFHEWVKDGWTDWEDWSIQHKKVYAKFTARAYAIRFMDTDGNLLLYTQWIMGMTWVELPTPPQIPGYDIQWDFTRESLLEIINKEEYQYNTIYVYCTEKTPIVYYAMVKSASGSVLHPFTVESLTEDDNQLTLFVPETQEGYAYVAYGATIVSGQEGGKLVLRVSTLGDFIVEEKPIDCDYTFLVTFEGYEREYTTIVGQGETTQLPTPTKEGYKFVGWKFGEELLTGSHTFAANEHEVISLTAEWSAIAYTLQFNNAESLSAETLTYDETYILPVVERTGYFFEGWEIAGKTYAAGESISGLTEEDGGVVTASAIWRAIQYNVAYNANGGTTTPVNHVATFDVWFNLPTYIYKEGYLLDGWWLDGEETSFAVGERVCNLISQQAATVTLTAQWKPITYTVVFDNCDVEDMVCTYNQEYQYPEVSKEDYMFMRWAYYVEGDDKYESNPQAKVFSNLATQQGAIVVMTAEWESLTDTEYMVSFDTKGLTYVPSQTIASGETLILPTTEKAGYHFEGWKLGDAEYAAGDTFENVNKQATIHFTAMWTLIEYDIVFEGTSHTAKYTVETKVEDIDFPRDTAALDKTGYICTWVLPETLIGDIYAPLERKPISFTLQFVLNGGKGIFMDRTVYYGADIVLGEPTHATNVNLLFAGWKAEDGTVYDGAEAVSAQFTAEDGGIAVLAATWSGSEPTYTATFIAEGRVAAMIEFTSSACGKRLIEPEVPAKSVNGEHYIGTWADYTLQENDLTIEAIYTPKAYLIEYYYQINGGEVCTFYTAYYTVETPTLALPFAPSVEGYLFDSFESVYLDGGDKQVQAIYLPISYTVSFDTDGGSEVRDMNVTYNQSFTLNHSSTKPGYTFAGWLYNGTVYETGDSFINLASVSGAKVVFTAHWDKNDYVLTYDPVGGQIVGASSLPVTYLDDVTLERAPLKAGYDFVGWSIGGQTYDAESQMSYAYTSDMTAKAVWKAIEYYVIFSGVPENRGGVQIWTVESGAITEPAFQSAVKWLMEKDGQLVDYELAIENFTYNEENARYELVLQRQTFDFNPYKVEFRIQENNALVATRYYGQGLSNTIVVPEVPTKTGYLGEWDISGISSNDFTYVDGKLTIGEGATSNVVIYARYTAITYTVVYLVDGVEVFETEATYDQSFESAAAPSKVGYTFDGWALDGVKYEGEWINLCQEYMGKVELNAILTPIEYVVVYNANGGDFTPESITVKYNETFVLPEGAGVYAGKDFGGWKHGDVTYAAGAEINQSLTDKAETITLYAQWISKAYTATFVDEAGRFVGVAKFRDQKFEDESTLPTVPEKAHYEGEWDIPTLGESDVTIYPIYQAVSYQAVFKIGGDTIHSTMYTVENAPIFPIVDKAHYEAVWEDVAFDGGDKTIVGRYVAIEYTLTFYKAEGCEDIVDEVIYTVDNTNVTLPAVPAGYVAWNMPELDGGDKAVYPMASVEGGYVVTFVDQVGQALTSLVLNEDNTLTKEMCPAVPVRQGYTGEWILPDNINANVTIRPQYTAIVYTVTFVDENGVKLENNGEASYTVQNDNITIPAVPEKAHYTGVWDLPELTYGNVTVRPIYTPIAYTVSFYNRHNELIATRVYTIEDQSFNIPEVPDEIGYLNKRWSDYDLSTLQNITVTAEYAVSQYHIQYVVDGCIGSTSPNTPEGQNNIPYDTFITIAPYTVPTGYKTESFTGEIVWEDQFGTIYTPGEVYTNLTAENNETLILTMYLAPIKYTIAYYSTVSVRVGVTVTYDEDFTMPKMVTQVGYIFDNYWYDGKGNSYQVGQVYKNLTTVDGETIWLSYNKTPITYVVKFYDRHGNPIKIMDASYDQSYTTRAAYTEAGYTFHNWQYNGKTIGANTEFKNLTANNGEVINMTPSMTQNKWTITLSPGTGSTLTVTVGGKSYTSGTISNVTYGTYFTVSVVANTNYKDAKYTCNCGRCSGADHYMPDGNLTISSSAVESCVREGTLITLADGSVKKVEDLKLGDMLLVWNFATGTFDQQPVVLIQAHEDMNFITQSVRLTFSDGTNIELSYEHAFYDMTLRTFIFFNEENAKDYIGHTFQKLNVDKNGNAILDEFGNFTYGTVVLTGVTIEEKVARWYNFATAETFNHYANGLLGGPANIDWVLNIFEVGEDMKYDQEAMLRDIETYGLFTYEDFAAYGTREQFELYNAAVLKVSLGKSLVTMEEILEYIQSFVPSAE